MECIRSEQSTGCWLMIFAMLVTFGCSCNGISYLDEQKVNIVIVKQVKPSFSMT